MQPLGMRLAPCLLSAVWLGLTVSTSLAEPPKKYERAVSAISGEAIVIGRHMQWKTKDCSPNGLPAVKISQQPAHGAANLTAGPGTIGTSRNNPGQDQCRGKEVPGVILNYRSTPD